MNKLNRAVILAMLIKKLPLVITAVGVRSVVVVIVVVGMVVAVVFIKMSVMTPTTTTSFSKFCKRLIIYTVELISWRLIEGISKPILAVIAVAVVVVVVVVVAIPAVSRTLKWIGLD